MNADFDSAPLIEHTANQSAAYAVYAVELLLESAKQHPHQPGDRKSQFFSERAKIKSWRAANSSIIHACCALDHAVTHIFYQLYQNEESNIYVAKDSRDKRNKEIVRDLKGRGLAVKIETLVLLHETLKIPPKTLGEIRELAEIRNFLVHGLPHKHSVLLSASERRLVHTDFRPDGKKKFTFSMPIADQEDTLGDWGSKFCHTKFNKPRDICYHNALGALRISMGAINSLNKAFSQSCGAVGWWGGTKFFLSLPSSENPQDLLHINDFPSLLSRFNSYNEPRVKKERNRIVLERTGKSRKKAKRTKR